MAYTRRSRKLPSYKALRGPVSQSQSQMCDGREVIRVQHELIEAEKVLLAQRDRIQEIEDCL